MASGIIESEAVEEEISVLKLVESRISSVSV
jgi:hypothetical protein